MFTCIDVASACGLRPEHQEGAEVFFLCPVHEDHHPSLQVNQKKDVWLCGPCGKDGTAYQLLAFLSHLDPTDKRGVTEKARELGLLNGHGQSTGAVSNRQASPQADPTKSRVLLSPSDYTAAYDYLDSAGDLRFQVLRYEGGHLRSCRPDCKEKKHFTQRRPANGKWAWNLKDVKRVPFRLPQILKAETILWVEGEKDVLTAEALGFAATTSPQGASSFKHLTEVCGYLKPTHRVVIIPDRDAAGKRYSNAVAALLSGKVAEVRILELPGLPEKGDLSEWARGKDQTSAREGLAKLMTLAPLYSSPEAAAGATGFVAPTHWRRLDASKVHEWNCSPLHPIVDQIIAHGNFVFVAAQTQTKKTLLALYMALFMLNGGRLFGRYQITPIEKVLYFVLEDPDRRIEERLKDFEVTVSAPDRFIVYVCPGLAINDDPMWYYFRKVIQDEKPQVVFLDTYQRATPGFSSFDDERQGPIIHRCANLSRELGVTLIVLDHVRKEAGGRRDALNLDSIKGTGGKVQNADCVILMEKAGPEEVKFQAFSKDFEPPVSILLKVSHKGSGSDQPKFAFASDFAQRREAKVDRKEQEILKAVTELSVSGDPWISAGAIGEKTGIPGATLRRVLKDLCRQKRLRRNGEEAESGNRWTKYSAMDQEAENGNER